MSRRNGAAPGSDFSAIRSPSRRWARAVPRRRSPSTCTPRSSCRSSKAPEVAPRRSARIADLVVRQRKLIGGNFSEPGTTSLIGERPLSARARRVTGGYSVTGRKMFASMIEAADYCMVLAYPDEATGPSAGILLLVPPDAAGRRVIAELGHARDARDAQRLPDPRRLPVAGRCGGVPLDDIRPFRLAISTGSGGRTPRSISAWRKRPMTSCAGSCRRAGRKATPSRSPTTRTCAVMSPR